MNFKLLIGAVLALTIAVVGCDDGTPSNGGTGGAGGGDGGTGGGDGGSGGSGGGDIPWVPIADCDDIEIPTAYSIDAPATDLSDCNVDNTIEPTGLNDAAALNAAIELASSGGTICLGTGDWDMEGSVFVSDKQNLTIKGTGAGVMDTKLDYEGARRPRVRRHRGRLHDREPMDQRHRR